MSEVFGAVRQWMADFVMSSPINEHALNRLWPGLSYFSRLSIYWCERPLWQRLGFHLQAVMVSVIIGAVLGYTLIGLCAVGSYFALNELVFSNYRYVHQWVAELVNGHDTLAEEELNVDENGRPTLQSNLEQVSKQMLQNASVVVDIQQAQTANLQAIKKDSDVIQERLSSASAATSEVGQATLLHVKSAESRAIFRDKRKKHMKNLNQSLSVAQQLLAQHRQRMAPIDAEIAREEQDLEAGAFDPNGNPCR